MIKPQSYSQHTRDFLHQTSALLYSIAAGIMLLTHALTAEAITIESTATNTTGSAAFDFHFEVSNATTLENPKSPSFKTAKATPGKFPSNNTADFTDPIPAGGIANGAAIKFSWKSGLFETNSILDAYWTDKDGKQQGPSVTPTRVNWHFLNNSDGTVTLDIVSPAIVGIASIEFWQGLARANLDGPDFFDLLGPLPNATKIFSEGSGSVGAGGQILEITYMPSGLDYDVFRMTTSLDSIAIAFNNAVPEPSVVTLFASAVLALGLARCSRKLPSAGRC